MADESDIFDSSSSENSSEYLANLNDKQRESTSKKIANFIDGAKSKGLQATLGGAGVAVIMSSLPHLIQIGLDPISAGMIVGLTTEHLIGKIVDVVASSDEDEISGLLNSREVIEQVKDYLARVEVILNDQGTDLESVLSSITSLKVQSDNHMQVISRGFKRLERLVIIQNESIDEAEMEVNNLPRYRRKNYFTGRRRELKSISKSLNKSDGIAITGESGIGKSMLVREYVQRNKEDYKHIIWIDASNEKSIEVSIKEVASSISRQNPRYMDDELGFLDWIRQCSEPYLIVFDGVPDYASIERYLPPQSENGKVIVTSVNKSLHSDFSEVLHIDGFDLNEAVDLLDKRVGVYADNESHAIELAKALGLHPLALEHAAAYLKYTQISFSEYLQLFNEAMRDVSELPDFVTQEDRILAVVDGEIMRLLEYKIEESVQIAFMLAFMSSEKIPRGIFYGFDELPLSGIPRTLLTEDGQILIRNILGLMNQFSIVDLDKDYIYMSKATQRAIINDMTEEEESIWLENSFRTLYTYFAFNENDSETWSEFKEVAPHIQSVLNHIYSTGQEIVGDATLSRKLAYAFYDLGQYEAAELIARKTLEIDINRHGEDSLQVGRDYFLLGHIKCDQARSQPEFIEPYEYFQKSYQLVVAHSMKNSIEWIAVVSGLAGALLGMGNLSEAKALADEVIQGLRESSPTAVDQEQFAIALSNLAQIYEREEEFSFALELISKSLEYFYRKYDREHFPAGHPIISELILRTGVILRKLGLYEKSVEQFEAALTMKRNLFKSDLHPRNSYCLRNIGECHMELANNLEAVNIFRYKLSIDHELYGSGFSLEVVMDHYRLAQCYLNLGDIANAKSYIREVERLMKDTEKWQAYKFLEDYVQKLWKEIDEVEL